MRTLSGPAGEWPGWQVDVGAGHIVRGPGFDPLASPGFLGRRRPGGGNHGRGTESPEGLIDHQVSPALDRNPGPRQVSASRALRTTRRRTAELKKAAGPVTISGPGSWPLRANPAGADTLLSPECLTGHLGWPKSPRSSQVPPLKRLQAHQQMVCQSVAEKPSAQECDCNFPSEKDLYLAPAWPRSNDLPDAVTPLRNPPDRHWAIVHDLSARPVNPAPVGPCPVRP